MLISFIAVIITFALVIFIHELGHFIACRAQGIRVDEFSFGFGKEIIGVTRGYTRYSIRWIMLGGYVKMAGESIEVAEGHDYEYFAKPWYRRILVALAGPAMNYLLAFVLFASVIFFAGEPVVTDKPIIGDLASGYPAEVAGLKKDDRILAVNGTPVETWEQMALTIHALAEQNVQIKFSRAGEEKDVVIVPRKDPSGKIGIIGITPATSYKPVSAMTSFKMGAYQCWYWTAYSIKTLAEKVYKREKPDLAGPIGIVHMVSKAAHSGFADLVFFIGLISVAVGMFNVFPIPVLDGGQILLYLWEGVSRRKLTEKIFSVANYIGMSFLLLLMVFATYSDITRLMQKNPTAKQSSSPQQDNAAQGK